MYTYEMNAGYSDMDESLQMTIPAILDCFQDAAIFEAQNGKITVEYLYDRQIAWLLSSWQIVIERRPRLNERIRIATVPYEFRGFLGYRNFTLTGEDGRIIVKGASIWTLIDTNKLLPVKPTQELINGYQIGEKLDMNYAPRKIALLGDGAEAERFQVRKYQIDSNRHMNNVEYVKLAMETLPKEASIKELRVEYKKAAHAGDEIMAQVAVMDNKHQVVLKASDKEIYAIVEFTLAKIVD
ncbi:MAG: acyl-[acyl-carrier-protein] thioesterase [Lachnospiraceae bacterium]|nr:acyl-[acyl-carrier-protein] thioesterase [Lachnospiraceae bacterium]